MYYCVQDWETEEGIFTTDENKAMEYMIRLYIQYDMSFHDPIIKDGIKYYYFGD